MPFSEEELRAMSGNPMTEQEKCESRAWDRGAWFGLFVGMGLTAVGALIIGDSAVRAEAKACWDEIVPERVCAARSGRYLDGKCYDAAGLREVKP
jgi:hypothetical protein